MYSTYLNRLFFCLATLLLIACSDGQNQQRTIDNNIDNSNNIQQNISEKLQIDFSDLTTAKKSLENVIKELNTINYLANLDIDIDLSITASNPDELTDKETQSSIADIEKHYIKEPLTTPTEETVKTTTDNYINNIKMNIHQSIEPPKSTLSLHIDASNGSYTNTDNSENSYSFITNNIQQTVTIKHIYYNDQTAEKVAINQTPTSYSTPSFDIPTAKVIDLINIETSFEYPASYKQITLSDDNDKITIDSHEVTFKRMADNIVELHYPSVISDRITHIEGMYSATKAIKINNEKSLSLPKKPTIDYLKKINTAYKKALKKINTNRFKDTSQLKTFIDKNLPKTHRKIQSFTTAKYEFHGPIKTLALTISSAQMQSASITITANNIESKKNKTGYYIAHQRKNNTATNKMELFDGLVDNKGQWLIEPNYKVLDYKQANFYASSYASKHFFLDRDKNTMIPVDYSPTYWLSDTLIEVINNIDSTTTDAPPINRKGVFDTVAKTLIIPLEYYDYRFNNNIIVAERKIDDDTTRYSAYDTQGNIILSNRNHSIDIGKNYLYSRKKQDSNHILMAQIFDRKGNQLTKENWGAVHIYGSMSMYSHDDLQVVEKCTPIGDDNYQRSECIYGVINNRGEMAFKTDRYTFIRPFSNGLAAVQNKNKLWGYINRRGKLVIPFKFKEARSFKFAYTLVKLKNNDDALINQQGQVFKNFKKALIQTSSSIDREVPTVYTLKNGKKYTDKGTVIK